jgi:N-acetylglutamate synthase-like GNAT family acetyltransferase
LIAIIRADNCCIKVLIIDKSFRRQGIGKKLLKEIIKRVKLKYPETNTINFGISPPNYMLPGLDLRHTDLFFFLKRNWFKPKDLRQSLTVPLKNLALEPKSEKKGIFFERIQQKDFNKLVNFVEEYFGLSPWPDEVKLALNNDPPTIFIGKSQNNKIIGWATHSVQYPSSFGPIGVLISQQGNGIGTELLKWCLWDIKKRGFDTCHIMWVGGRTAKFYSKTIDAYIFPVYYDMVKKLH